MIFRATKAAAKTQSGRKAGKLGVGAAAKAGNFAGKAALKVGKGQAKLAGQALNTREPVGKRYLKYGFFALAGFAVGALVARSGEKEIASPSFADTTGQGGETWGGGATPTGMPPGTASSGVSDPARPEQPQRPEDPNRTGPDREYSDPSAGPLIGRSHPAEPPPDIPVQHQEIANRIRTRVGEDPRTLHLPRLNVEVNDDVAEIYGEVHSEEDKRAVEEIAADADGVNEVRNHLAVNPQSPTRENKAAGGDPDRPS